MPLEVFETRLEKISFLTPTVRAFRLQFEEGKEFSFQAGQFAMVHIPGADKVHKKAYSITSAPFEKGYLDLCIKFVEGGMATTWFWERKEGDLIKVAGPYGNFLLREPVEDDPIFIATGTGVAPLRSMIRQGYHDRKFPSHCQVTLIFGVRYEEELFYGDEFRLLEKEHSNFRFIPTISRPAKWEGAKGYVQETLKKEITGAAGKRIYVCGLSPMIRAVEETALALGFEKGKIHYEKYS